MMLFRKISVIFLLLIFFVKGNLNAGIETKNARIEQPALGTTGATLSISDDKFPQFLTIGNGFTTVSSKLIAEFGIDQNKKVFHNHAFQSTLIFQYQTYDVNLFVSAVQTDTLRIIYDPAVSTNVSVRKDKSFLELTNVYKINIFNIQLTSIDLDNGNISIPNPSDLYLEAEVQTERYYDFDVITSVPNNAKIAYNEIKNTALVPYELEVYWDYIPGAEEYELEWTYIDNYDQSSVAVSVVKPDNLLPYDLDHDATHIVTPNQFFRIPLTYEKGVILFRVRGVGRNKTNPAVRLEGPWSNASSLSSGTVDSYVLAYPNQSYHFMAPFHENINWAAAKTFAEKGKKGNGVSFKDGAMHVRQNLAKLNTDDKVIVQSILYDFQGRPSITTLPAPMESREFFYKEKQNMFSSTVQYDKNIFQNTSGCNGAPFPMDPVNSTGAANYYSANNLNKDAQQGHIADANGFPFVQVEYFPDGHGRIKRQTLPGPVHQFNSGHEMQFFYVTPTQDELARMFGSEVGLQDRYEKRLAVDPNGQVSVAYIDGEERIVATALSGAPPSNVDEIEESQNASATANLNQNLIINNYPDPNNLSYSSTASFYAGVGELIQTIDYNLTAQNFTDSCLPPGFCFDCLYELDIDIKDDCGNDIPASSGFTPVHQYVGNPTVFDATCSSPSLTFSLPPSSPLTVTLPAAGVYHITKTLKVSTLPVQAYVQLYLQNNTCLQSLSSFQQTALNSIDFSGCTGVTCQQCSTAVNAYASNNPGQLTPSQVAGLLANCNSKCNSNNECSAKTQVMLQQFSPGGQYATYVNSSGTFTSSDPYSIFNPANILNSPGPVHTYANPPTPYLDALGNPALALNTAAVLVSPGQLTPNEFISGFQPSWANAWLLYHPEYCKKEFNCLPDVAAASGYIKNFSATGSLDDACISGLAVVIDPSVCVLAGAPLCTCTTHVYDPLLSSTDPHLTSFNATACSDLQNFSLPGYNGNCPAGSIYQVVMNAVRGCGNVPANATLGDDPCTRDQEWALFKAIYMGYHNQAIQNAQNYFVSHYTGPGKCYTPPSGTIPSNNATYLAVFPDPITSGGGVDLSTYQASINSSNNGSSTAQSTNASSCNQTCAGYAASWLQALAPCMINPADWDVVGSDNDIQGNLIAICAAGCDANSPFGASNVNSGPITLSMPNGTMYSASSFQDVLTQYGYPQTSTCGALLISMPQTYGHSYSSSASTEPLLDKCGCNKILSNHYLYTNNSSLACQISESAYFTQQNGTGVNDYAAAFCACSTAVASDVASPPLSANYQMTSVAAQNLDTYEQNLVTAVMNGTPGAGKPDYISSSLACNKCIDCGTIKGLNQVLIRVFGGVPLNTIDHTILVNFLNSQYNMNNTYDEWITFIKDCNQLNSGNHAFSSNLSQQAIDLPVFLTAVTALSTSSAVLTPGNMPSFFSSSLYPSSNMTTVAGQSVNYGFSSNSTQVSITLNNSLPYSCGLTFTCTTTIPVPFPTNQGRFYNLQGDCIPEPGTKDLQTGFIVDYDYVDGSGNLHTLVFEGSTNCFSITNTNIYSSNLTPSCGPVLCNDGTQGTQTPENDCISSLINNALNSAQASYTNYTTPYVNQFMANYKNNCFANVTETFNRKYVYKEYHYTLYYYDQAGNLVHTVPPKGVTLLNAAQTLSAENNIIDPVTYPTRIYPDHSLNSALAPSKFISDYHYNTFNEPIANTSPDGGLTVYFYDQVGRPVASQNAKQRNFLQYSYTFYDALGRIVEVGMLQLNTSSSPLSNAIAANPTLWNNFVNGNLRREVTHTYYDAPLNPTVNSLFGANGQQNLRKRIGATTYELLNDNNPNTFDYGTYYSYDDHGNVNHLVQDNPALAAMGAFYEYKHIFYEYDIESGNVNQVNYQPGQVDQFYHKYFHDADNRLHEVLTSKDGFTWDRDAKYFFYEHGPHGRTEHGQDQVQGTDFAYTIQGWIKGVNSNILTRTNDLGQDGATGNTYMQSFAGVHLGFAKDAASYNLNYFNGDYSAIKTSANNFLADKSLLNTGGFDLAADAPDQFNSNISSMVTSIININPVDANNYGAIMPQITAYRYDQLRRIKHMKAYSSYNHNGSSAVLAMNRGANQWYAPTASNYKGMYECSFDFDRNGNLTKLTRAGHYNGVALLQMDNLKFGYVADKNQLAFVQDGAPTSYDAAYASNYSNDIDDQVDPSNPNKVDPSNPGTYNYQYDDIGQLVHNTQEEIDLIEWNIRHKVVRITRTATSIKPDVEFLYDAQGHRVAKIVKPRNGSGLVPSSRWVTTYYIRDLQGNLLSTYQVAPNPLGLPVLKLQEFEIYGNGREGSVTINQELYPAMPAINRIVDHVQDQKQYELTNHSGNVITTISDRKIQEDGAGTDIGSNGTVDYYTANIISATDYYPYGQTMPGRSFNNPNYRFGHNGQEKDNEIFEGALGAEYWEYDARIGMRWDTDPKAHADISPYACFAGNPIMYSDPDGDDLGLGLALAAFKAVLSVTEQFIENLIAEGSAKEAFKKIDWGDVIDAAVGGFVEGLFFPVGGAGEILISALQNMADAIWDWTPGEHDYQSIFSGRFVKPWHNKHHKDLKKAGGEFLLSEAGDLAGNLLHFLKVGWHELGQFNFNFKKINWSMKLGNFDWDGNLDWNWPDKMVDAGKDVIKAVVKGIWERFSPHNRYHLFFKGKNLGTKIKNAARNFAHKVGTTFKNIGKWIKDRFKRKKARGGTSSRHGKSWMKKGKKRR